MEAVIKETLRVCFESGNNMSLKYVKHLSLQRTNLLLYVDFPLIIVCFNCTIRLFVCLNEATTMKLNSNPDCYELRLHEEDGMPDEDCPALDRSVLLEDTVVLCVGNSCFI